MRRLHTTGWGKRSNNMRHAEFISASYQLDNRFLARKTLKQFQSNSKKGFTLAEVLITLVVIGVIAALTITNLIQTTEDHEIKSRAKKAYSALQQAVNMEYAQTGRVVGDDGLETYNDIKTNLIGKRMKANLKVYTEPSYMAGYIECTLIDGTYIGVNDAGNGTAHLYFDVNGQSKGPNKNPTVGDDSIVDRYYVTIIGNKVYPGYATLNNDEDREINGELVKTGEIYYHNEHTLNEAEVLKKILSGK